MQIAFGVLPLQRDEASDFFPLHAHRKGVGGREALAVVFAELHPRAQHAPREGGQTFGQKEQPAVGERRHRPLGGRHKKVCRKLSPRLLCGAVAPHGEGAPLISLVLAALFEEGGKVPFPLHLMRHEAVLLQQRKLGMAGKEVFRLPLVLPAREGAGRIHEPSARPHEARRRVQDIPLAGNAAGNIFLAPFPDGFGVFAEHPLARAGRVHQHFIEKSGQRFGELFRGGADDGAVFDAHALDVLREDLRAAGHIFVGDEHALPRHRGGELRRLAPGRGAKIEDALFGLHVEERRSAHRRGLLTIV